MGRCDYPSGTPQNPIRDEETLKKFKGCAGLALNGTDVEKAAEFFMNLDGLGDLKDPMKIFGGF